MKNILEIIPADKHADILAGDLSSTYDCTADFQYACNNYSKIFVPKGRYRTKHVDKRPGNELIGENWGAIIHQVSGENARPGGYDGMFTMNYANDQIPHRDMAIRNLTLQMDTPTGPYKFSEFYGSDADESCHMILIGHTESVAIDHVQTIGGRGDHIFVGAQMSGINVPINYVAAATKITDCWHDGVNNTNRNGITIGSVDGLDINRGTYLNLCNQYTPGAICLEPELPYAYARNIRIKDNNRFYSIGPSFLRRRAFVIDLGGQIFSQIERRGNITFSGNHAVDTNWMEVKGAPCHGVTVEDNWVYGSQTQLEFFNVKGLAFRNNRFDYVKTMMIGYPGKEIYEFSSSGNVYNYCGPAAGGALMLHRIENGNVHDDFFIDCGGADGAIALTPSGTTNGLRIHDIGISSPNSVTPFGVHVHAGHTRDATSRIWDITARGAPPAVWPPGTV